MWVLRKTRWPKREENESITQKQENSMPLDNVPHQKEKRERLREFGNHDQDQKTKRGKNQYGDEIVWNEYLLIQI